MRAARIDSVGFPETTYTSLGIADFCKGNAVAQAHYAPSLLNTAALLLSMDKMCLHIRDPRSAAISWLHFMDYSNENSDHVKYSPQHAPYIGKHWQRMSFDEKFSVVVKFFYTECIEWLGQWFSILHIDWEKPRKNIFTFSTDFLRGADKLETIPYREISVLLTTYEDMMRQGEDTLFTAILDFYDMNTASFWQKREEQRQERTMASMHFRKGSIDSWRTECSQEQQKMISRMLPDAWCAYFGWEKENA